MMGLLRRVLLMVASVVLLAGMPSSAMSRETTMPLAEARDLFAAGNAFYRAQQYEEAQVAYRELLDAGYETAPVLYNLGTANARLGSSTLARASLARAKTLRPRDPDIRANLEYVKAAQPVRLPGAPVDDGATAESIWERVYGWLTAEEWLMLSWVALLILAGGVAVVLLARRAGVEAAGRAMALLGLVSVALLAVPTVAQVYATKIRKMAMVTQAAEMRSGPAPRFTRINSLEEGQTLRVLGHESDNYVRVQTDEGVTGYVEQDALARI
jgi:tetratricopeptide (TPR) repeat protein